MARKEVTIDVLGHANLQDWIKILIVFFLPGILIYLFLLATYYDGLDQTVRGWIATISIILGFIAIILYITFVLLPKLIERIGKKERTILYESKKLNMDDDSKKILKAQEKKKIKELATELGLSEAEARIHYSAINFDNVDEEIKQLKALPVPAKTNWCICGHCEDDHEEEGSNYNNNWHNVCTKCDCKNYVEGLD